MQTNFVDILQHTIAAQTAADNAVKDAKKAEELRRENLLKEKLSPVITLFEQTRAAYPEQITLSTWWNSLYVFTRSDTKVVVRYNEETGEFSLKRNSSGYGYNTAEVLLVTKKVEDLLPPLLEILAKAIRERHR